MLLFLKNHSSFKRSSESWKEAFRGVRASTSGSRPIKKERTRELRDSIKRPEEKTFRACKQRKSSLARRFWGPGKVLPGGGKSGPISGRFSHQKSLPSINRQPGRKWDVKKEQKKLMGNFC